MGPVKVEGEIRFAPGEARPAAATVWVRLLDVSYADAPSLTVAEERIPLTGVCPLRFVFAVAKVDPGVQYAVSAHVDLAGDGRIRPGDWVTAQRYAVLTFGHGTSLEIEVQPVC